MLEAARNHFTTAAVFSILLLGSSASVAVPMTMPVCKKPDISFQTFLRRFADDVAFQRSRIVLPLVARAGDGVTTETTIALWSLARIRALKDPLIYPRNALKREHLDQHIEMLDDRQGYAELFQFRDEADSVKLLYRFRRHGGCWALEEFNDISE